MSFVLLSQKAHGLKEEVRQMLYDWLLCDLFDWGQSLHRYASTMDAQRIMERQAGVGPFGICLREVT
ncbi:hypothetical protein FisN_2Lu443 [Fistulifera solaris]|uniref:Uncharacterized protein n=1 Tax=Fistulifera solaris TaxID=1519565 RepID=A0A1Z5JPZ6_FISSO|nr:hypothetical protein FisN_2Lu443 [Fistulifera solaris]|eukprot:GAX15838.1 hypothetical protein FisN_2Lu443 [Fistulifera solaris]